MKTIDIRWVIRQYMPSVLSIEQLSFEFPWNEEQFIRTLRQRENIGMAAIYGDEVVGYMVYALGKYRIELLNMAVHPDFRRQFVGSAMIEKLVSKLEYQRRNRIELLVRETHLGALNFFKSLGFLATGLVQDKYEETTEDAIAMRFDAKPVETSLMQIPANKDAVVR